MAEPDIAAHLRRKQQELQRWLGQNAPTIERDQGHLHDGTPERAYWHYGYYVALRDIAALLGAGPTR